MKLTRWQAVCGPICFLGALGSSPASGTSEAPARLHETIVTAEAEQAETPLAPGAKILEGKDLERMRGNSLAETVGSAPGVRSAAAGPGAARPVVRGFQGDRVKLMEDGASTGDLSAYSPDHGVPLETMFTDQVTLLRGPAVLLHGGSAIGGAVDARPTRIPRQLPAGKSEGFLEGRWGSADHGRTGAAASTVRVAENWALRLEGLARKTEDYDIPGLARVERPPPAGAPVVSVPNPKGTLPGSWTRTENGAVGLSRFAENGWFGLAAQAHESGYGVPLAGNGHSHGGAGVTANPEIEMSNRRLDFTGELEPSAGPWERLTLRSGQNTYEHAESDGGAAPQRYHSEGWDARLGAEHRRWGNLTGEWVLHSDHRALASRGPSRTAPDTSTQASALAAVERLETGPLTWEGGFRLQQQRLRAEGRTRDLVLEGTAPSFTAGATWHLPDQWEIQASANLARRDPNAEEQFSNGPHLGSGIYQIGGWFPAPGVPGSGGGLEREEARGLEFALRKTEGVVTGSLTIFHQHFDNYVFPEALGPGWEIRGLPIHRFVQREAVFDGGEVEVKWRVWEEGKTRWLDWGVSYDWVRATDLTKNRPLPRIPAGRAGTRLELGWDAWTLGTDLSQTFAQKRVQTGLEYDTDGFTLLGLDAAWRIASGKTDWTLFLRGTNLLDEEAREHASFLKEGSPQPGRGLTAGLRIGF